MEATRRWSSRYIAFIAIMGALGNALFALSSQVLSVPGGIAGISLDLSNLGVVIAAVFGGYLAGATVGLIAGILPGIWFGYGVGGAGILALIGLPVGKALTGLTIGILCNYFKIFEVERKSLKTVFIVLVGYIPEMLFTILYFATLMPMFLGFFVGWIMVTSILIKAWTEMAIIGILAGGLVSNVEFVSFLKKYFEV